MKPSSSVNAQAGTSISIFCADGRELAGHIFEPAQPELVVVIHSATGVPQGYYKAFAQWLCTDRNAAVLTYDYRDTGASSIGPIRKATSTMGQWGVEDQGAALDYVCERYADLPVEVIGHSLGGLFLAFHANAHRVKRMTAVASGPAYWTQHPLKYIAQVIVFWFLVGPLVTRLAGYMPGRLLGMGADLPADVYWQWRKWCISRGFQSVDWGAALPLPKLERVTCDIRIVAIEDDVMIPPSVTQQLARFYPDANICNEVINPSEVGLKSIGHLRVFSQRCSAAWPLVFQKNRESWGVTDRFAILPG